MALIEQVESQDFVGIGFVGEPKKSPERLLSQRAQRLHACAQRLSVRKHAHTCALIAHSCNA